MAVSIRQFNIELYEEHLEEASFLYEQRLFLLDDPEINWKDLDEIEDRFEAHIDALVVGEELALEVCRRQAHENDFGELHAAVRLFCRRNRGDLVAEAWHDLDTDDIERSKAIRDALKDECPEDWKDSLLPIFLRDYFNLIPVMSPVFGYRRFNAEDALLHVLTKAPDHILVPVIWALGRIGGKQSHKALLPFIDHSNHAIRQTAAESLLRFGASEVIARCLSSSQSVNWAVTALALGGGRSAFALLLDRIKQGNLDSECLIALGLLGNLSSLKVLHSFLESEDLARAAATGMYLVTGAEIYEEVYIPEEIDEDEMFEEELEAYRRDGTVPTKPDREPFGETVRRLSQNPSDWETWLRGHKSQFNPEYRYRLGMPYSPASLLQTLLSETSPFRARQLAIEELKVRYNADFPIEADMPVVEQETILSQIAQWVQVNESRFQPGAWYFAGRLMQS